jgi:hypothetical protein
VLWHTRQVKEVVEGAEALRLDMARVDWVHAGARCSGREGGTEYNERRRPQSKPIKGKEGERRRHRTRVDVNDSSTR